MLYQFLKKNVDTILTMTEAKSNDLAGQRPSSEQLRDGLPIFFKQLIAVLTKNSTKPIQTVFANKPAMTKAADDSNEAAMVRAEGRPDEAILAETAAMHGKELLRLGYTLSHVVHSYGSICQSITELATKNNSHISPKEFHDLNRCLDMAIAGAVTEYQKQSILKHNTLSKNQEVEQLGFLAHELRNALSTVKLSFELIKEGTVGLNGSVSQVMERGLNQMDALIERSLTEVRLQTTAKIRLEAVNLNQLVDQILVTARIEARNKNQILNIQIDPALIINVDQPLFYSALYNVIQNAIKYSKSSSQIKIGTQQDRNNIYIKVEDSCGGLSNPKVDLFKPFEQIDNDRKGLGLGLTITRKAIIMNNGTIDVEDRPGKGCVFKITLPKDSTQEKN